MKVDFYDINGKLLKVGDVFKMNQTINGSSDFYVESLNPLDIRYNYDRSRIYEYDMIDLISPSKLLFEPDFEIL